MNLIAGRRILIACMCLSAAAFAFGGQPSQDGGRSAFDPRAGASESALLHEALELASDSAEAAIAMLLGHDLDGFGPSAFFVLGNLYFEVEDFENAEKSYLTALSKFPLYRGARSNLGLVYMSSGQLQKAIDVYRSMIRDGQSDYRTLTLLGRALILGSRPLSAESAFRQALLLEPDSGEAMSGLARSLLEQKRYAEGVALLKEISALEPFRPEIWDMLCNASIAIGDHSEAVVSAEMANRIGVATAETLATLGDLYLSAGQPEDALRVYLQAFETAEASPERVIRAARAFLGMGMPEKARLMIGRAAGLGDEEGRTMPEPARVEFFRVMGDLAAMEGKPGEAVILYGQLLEKDPFDGRALIMLGDVLRQMGRKEEAALNYERAARVDGVKADALLHRAQLSIDMSDYRQALRFIQESHDANPRPAVADVLRQLTIMIGAAE